MNNEFMKVIGTRGALYISMEILNERQAQINHGQTLHRLNERGGLSLDEAAAIAQNRRWVKQTAEESIDELTKASERKGNL